MDKFPIIASVSGEVSAEQELAFSIIAPIDLPSIFTGYLFFPAVTIVDNNPPTWDKPGLIRYPKLSDGSSVTETMRHYNAPHSFSYELTNFTGIMNKIVSKAYGEWRFTTTPSGTTHIVWSYGFLPLPGRKLFVRYVIKPLFARYMQRVLRRALLIVDTASQTDS